MKPGEPLATGHMLDGRYRIEKIIGVGGMGRVYLANDTRLANRPVAVKEMMVGEGVHERKAVEDFAREARVLAPLSHPGIPNLIDYFAERGRHYLVMEYIAGGDLQGWLDQRGAGARVREAQVLRWARELLDVMSFLHSQSPPIVYRDLKPGNIMIDHNERAMLIDFGIARFLPPGGRGTQIGSVGYAPPEQYLGKLEPRSDLYSLGATMHHLLTGRDPQLEPPFSFPQVRQLAPEVSAGIERVVMWALEREADKRPASAAAMLEALPHPSDNDEPWLAAPHSPAVDAASSSMARMQTKVLSKLAAQPVKSAIPAARPSSAPAPAAAPSVSSTAKTADLKGKLKRPPARSSPKAPAPAQRPSAQPQTVRPAPAASVTASPQRQSPQPATGQSPRQRNGVSPVAAAPPVNVVRASLVCKNEERRFAIGGSRMVIGRRSGPEDELDIDLSVLKIGGDRVSRRHAEILQRGADYFVRDLGSLNGTFILGQGRLGRDQLYKLQDRDQVVIGSATLEFRRGGAA